MKVFRSQESGVRSQESECQNGGNGKYLCRFKDSGEGYLGVRSQNIRMREPAKRFQDLVVWQKAHQFVLDIYRLTGSFPKSETYGLSSQLRRSAVSIAANIAEGFKKRGSADKGRFLNIAQGSLEESRYYLILAADLGYGEFGELQSSLTEVSKLLDAYTKAILAPDS